MLKVHSILFYICIYCPFESQYMYNEHMLIKNIFKIKIQEKDTKQD